MPHIETINGTPIEPAEVIDARVAHNNTVYDSLGEHIRDVSGDLYYELDTLKQGGYVPDEQLIDSMVSDWLDEHPEATTTVQDNSITSAKLADAVRKGYVRTFDTVADMQAATDLKAGMTCHTNGFHEVGDGGSAYYIISDNGTANGMDVLACGSLLANLIYHNRILVDALGASGNDVSDDSDIIQRAFEIVPEGGRVIFDRAKTYYINDEIVIHTNGVIATSYETSEQAGSLHINSSRGFVVTSQGCSFSNITLLGNSNNAAIVFDRSSSGNTDEYSNVDATVHECTFAYFDECIHVFGRNVKFNDCLFSQSKVGVHFSPFILSDSSYAQIRGWRVEQCRFHGIKASTTEIYSTLDEIDCWCVLTDFDADSLRSSIQGIVVTNNMIDSDSRCGFYKGFAKSLNLSNNVWENGYESGALLAYLFTNNTAGRTVQCIIENNTVCSDAGRVSSEQNYSAIYWHNIVFGNKVSYAKVSNNMFWHVQRASIVANIDDGIISDNIIIAPCYDNSGNNEYVKAFIDLTGQEGNRLRVSGNYGRMQTTVSGIQGIKLNSSLTYPDNMFALNMFLNYNLAPLETSTNSFLSRIYPSSKTLLIGQETLSEGRTPRGYLMATPNSLRYDIDGVTQWTLTQS